MNLNVICLDDQREVLSALKKDMAIFKTYIGLSYCESALEARELIEDIDRQGNKVAVLISDHIMPNQNGIEFLIQIHTDARFFRTKKVLLTGLATHQDTIIAINKASIHQYIEKPWNPVNLLHTVKTLLTEYIMEIGEDYQEYISILDQPTLYRMLKNK